MGPLQGFLILFLTSMPSPSSGVSLPQEASNQGCKRCPAGEYQKSCSECAPCPAGSFTAEPNEEDQCRRCSGDCRPKFHLKVIQMCTSTSDVVCVCEEGYRCTHGVPYSENCRYCEIQETTTAATVHRPPAPPTPGRNRTTAGPCGVHTCGPLSNLAALNDTHSQKDKMSSLLPPTFACLFAGVIVALLVLVYISRYHKMTCFKNALAVLVCNKRDRKVSHQSKEPAHHFSRDSLGTKQPLPPPLPAAHLGPVHVHNPGTIIFSLLSQFTGQVGPTIEGGNAAETEKDDDRGCPVFQPAPSPSIHTSEEERSQETERIFFPSQEQGKDYHVSKEEVP